MLIDDPDAENYAAGLGSEFPGVEFRVGTNRSETYEQLAEADALVSFGYHIDRAAIERAPKLRWLQALSTGTDHLVKALGERREVILTSARGIHGPAVSELTLMLMLALARGLPKIINNQQDQRWERNSGALLAGKVVGIAGMGVIGEAIAQKCKAFGMTAIGFGSIARAHPDVVAFHSYGELAKQAPTLDFLVIVTPLNERTHGMFGAEVFSALKRTSLVINVGRGATVDEAALIDALRNGTIAGAGLDTFCTEPLSSDSPFWSLPNVIVTPHIGGVYDRYREDATAIIAHNVGAFIEGRFEEMVNRVDWARPESGDALAAAP